MPHSIFIVDDHPVLRFGLRTLLEREGYSVLGEAETGEQAFDDPLLLKVDLILLDIRLPGIDGLDLLQRIVTMKSEANVVIYTGYDNPIYSARAAALGARAIVKKDERTSVLLSCIQSARDGEFSQDMIERRRQVTQGGGTSTINRNRAMYTYNEVVLRQRELDVLVNLANGLTNREIAISLGIGYETVKEHVQHVLRKIGVKDRTQAAVWAVRQKIV